jgi:hypothetical protein
MPNAPTPPPLRLLIAACRCELRGLEVLAGTCELVTQVSDLVHALQKERGYSNLYLCSGDDALLPTLAALKTEAQRIEEKVRAFLAGLESDADTTPDKARLFNGIAYALYRLDALPGLRARIGERHVAPEEAGEIFTVLIASLLAVVFEAADSALDAAVTRTLVALLNFMQGKELSGQERAYGVMGYREGYFTEPRKARMRELVDAQARCFGTFEQYGPEEALAKWQAVRGQDERIVRMREMVQQTSDRARVDARLAELWFELCTERIDAMRAVESQLAESLSGQCRARIAAMRKELQNHRTLLDRFADQAGRAMPPMLFNVQGRILDTPPTDGVGTDMARSLLDMMREQTLRMQQANDALAQARALLDERRRIEQAKWLLVTHYRLSEQAAHDRLQRAAMEGGLSLAEVATRVLDELDTPYSPR